MGKHRADDANATTGRAAGQSTSEQNGGPKHDTGRPARHAAQETTPLTDRGQGQR